MGAASAAPDKPRRRPLLTSAASVLSLQSLCRQVPAETMWTECTCLLLPRARGLRGGETDFEARRAQPRHRSRSAAPDKSRSRPLRTSAGSVLSLQSLRRQVPAGTLCTQCPCLLLPRARGLGRLRLADFESRRAQPRNRRRRQLASLANEQQTLRRVSPRPDKSEGEHTLKPTRRRLCGLPGSVSAGSWSSSPRL